MCSVVTVQSSVVTLYGPIVNVNQDGCASDARLFLKEEKRRAGAISWYGAVFGLEVC